MLSKRSQCLAYLLTVFWLDVATSNDQQALRRLNESYWELVTCQRFFPSARHAAIAYSPARLLQVLAIQRNIEKAPEPENIQNKSASEVAFNVQNPQTWKFCVAGVYSNTTHRCRCYKNFAGDRCEKFKGHCWLFYCFLTNCHGNFDSLHCSCNKELSQEHVKTKEYWYDFGLSDIYIDPPPHFKEPLRPFTLAPMDKRLFIATTKSRKKGSSCPGTSLQPTTTRMKTSPLAARTFQTKYCPLSTTTCSSTPLCPISTCRPKSTTCGSTTTTFSTPTITCRKPFAAFGIGLLNNYPSTLPPCCSSIRSALSKTPTLCVEHNSSSYSVWNDVCDALIPTPNYLASNLPLNVALRLSTIETAANIRKADTGAPVFQENISQGHKLIGHEEHVVDVNKQDSTTPLTPKARTFPFGNKPGMESFKIDRLLTYYEGKQSTEVRLLNILTRSPYAHRPHIVPTRVHKDALTQGRGTVNIHFKFKI